MQAVVVVMAAAAAATANDPGNMSCVNQPLGPAATNGRSGACERRKLKERYFGTLGCCGRGGLVE
jgi:hypothetical protein